MSIFTYLLTQDIHISLTLLVIACPGALVISVPVSMVAAIGTSAKMGILIKGGDVIERLAKIDTVAFDKTGTLTVGRPTVVSTYTYGIKEKELLSIAAIGEAYSEHPFSQAIIGKAKELDMYSDEKPESVDHIQGKGIIFTYHHETFIIGNKALFDDKNISITNVLSDINHESLQKRTAIIVGTKTKVIGLIIITDKIRAESKTVLQTLKSIGIKKSFMLSGDNHGIAKVIAEQLQIDEYRGELLPEDKGKIIQEIQRSGSKVALVGDGINDAPSLALADVGIAIGKDGNDVAMETADMILLGESLERLIDSIRISRIATRNMKQNIFFAILVAFTLLMGVIVGSLTLSIGMFVHEISVILVILNALRIMRYPKHTK